MTTHSETDQPTAAAAIASTTQQDSSPASPPRVVIIGGGLAGIAAAVRLAQMHIPITLVETRKRLGGRATSFVDPTTSQVLDNCQHVVMKCCTNLLDLYQKLGVLGQIEWHKRFYFVDAKGHIDELSADDLPAPVHMTRSLLGFSSLTWGEKFAISRAMGAMMRTDREQWADRSFAQWLEAHDQPAGAVEKFWRPVVVGAINEWPERMAANAALQVFQEGFLAHEDAYWMGLATVPLVRLYDEAQRVIEAAGGSVMLGCSAESLTIEQSSNGAAETSITSLKIDGNRSIQGDVFISALPFDRLAKIAPDSLKQSDARLAHLDEFEVSPIIGIHLWLESTPDQPVVTLPHLSFMQSPLHWIFNKGYDAEAGGQHLHGVISAAHDLADQSAAQLADMVVRELNKALPATIDCKVLHSRVIKEKRATFSAKPGIDRIRPAASGSTKNLYLAGDWCASGWPATMEGAVRSGYLAAQAILNDAKIKPSNDSAKGSDTSAYLPTGLIADLPASLLYRVISGSY